MTVTSGFSFETTIVETTEVKFRKVAEGIHVYAIWKTSQVADKPTAKASRVKQGFIDDENLEKLKARKFDVKHFEPVKSGGDRRFVPVFLSPAGKEYVRSNGNPFSTSKVWEHLEREGMLKGLSDVDLLEMFEAGAQLDDLHFASFSDHSFIDKEGKPVPTAFRFDYIDANLANDVYDLQKAVDVLSVNPEMEIIPDRYTKRLIKPIPHYNCVEDRYNYVEVIWRPTEETWNDLLEQAAEVKDRNGVQLTSFKRHDLMTRFDVLGLIAAGCRLSDLEPKPTDGQSPKM